MKKSIIYKVTNLVNNKVYIGQTTNKLKYRKKQHINEAFIKNTNFLFHNALKKYGMDQFEWFIIWKGDTNLLNEKEIYYIKKYNSYFKTGYGYNMTIGGDSYKKGKNHHCYNHTLYTFYHKNGTVEKI